ncbi:hypothetical protein AVL55_10515 [Alteromonas macleodii]|uniref:Uncharacterized protein n=1 Tax=Alteromonas macleodii TaxID=28108 RepID=A0A126Q059_ALTMA|nr:hypothetical protein [Alteromonas macleodii]AMJ98565.1 hypothetical protein AVL55_10515 [Alteromonas macleodii]
MFNVKRVNTWILKKHKHLVESVEEDSAVVEVLLKKGFINAEEQETVWVFGKDRYESNDYTLQQIKADLRAWLSKVEPEEKTLLIEVTENKTLLCNIWGSDYADKHAGKRYEAEIVNGWAVSDRANAKFPPEAFTAIKVIGHV